MKNIILILIFIISLGSLKVAAQTDSLKISELNRDDILKMKTTVASKTELTPRETPGIVSIVTREEIQQSGARDLIEVLRMVPGINFAYDDGGVIGMHMRGNWGHEGKILLIIDGQEMNELKYNTLQFGRHFDVNSIKRIEVIRGPGSSIYGGSAELGVINITTEKGKDINGIKINSGYSQMGSSTGLANVGVSAGKKINDIELSFHGNFSDGIKSDKMFPTYKTFDLSKEGGDTRSTYFNFGLNGKKLGIKLIYDNYDNGFIYGTNAANVNLYTQSFMSYLGEIKYDICINKKLTITPKLNYKYNLPYYKDYSWVTSNSAMSRTSGNISFTYQPTDKVDIVGGVEYLYDLGKMVSDSPSAVFDNGDKSLSYNTVSTFIQGIIKTKPLNLIIGGRFDNHNEFGNAFAPRIGVTKVLDKFHFKLLYSGAFRSPSIGNLLRSDKIKPEKTTVAELELGYKLNDNMFITANVFQIDIKDPIVWFRVDTGYYDNDERTGSTGFELEYRAKYTKGFITINYSYYSVNNNTVGAYVNYAEDKHYLGAAQDKLSVSGSFNLTQNMSLSPSLIYIGKQFGNPFLVYTREIDPSLIGNFFIHYNNLFIKNLDLDLGVTDIFEQSPLYIQAYWGTQPFFPSPSREYCIKLRYTFGLN